MYLILTKLKKWAAYLNSLNPLNLRVHGKGKNHKVLLHWRFSLILNLSQRQSCSSLIVDILFDTQGILQDAWLEYHNCIQTTV